MDDEITKLQELLNKNSSEKLRKEIDEAVNLIHIKFPDAFKIPINSSSLNSLEHRGHLGELIKIIKESIFDAYYDQYCAKATTTFLDSVLDKEK